MTALGTPPRISPYVGPRAFKYGEHLFGRDREIAELVDLIISERVVLLYSPSGAGKSSLLQAGLQPQLERERFTVLPTIRVTHELRPGAAHGVPRNRYVLSTLLSLEEGVAKEQQLPTDQMVNVGLAEELDRLRAQGRAGNADGRQHECLVFDQFEELLTTDATDEAAKAAFMAEVGDALRDRQRWAIFAMREDFVAALDPYLGYLPTRLRARYRLDLLRQDAARLAIARPAEEIGVHIDPDAVGKLVDDLRRVRVQSVTGITEELGPYVEPVQLQVVCLRLLKPGVDHVSAADVAALGDVDNALTDYYNERVAAVAAETGVTERAIRDWFGGELITDQGLRAQVLRGPHGDENGGALERLESAHLIRAETRRGARWYELAHDRLVDPVRTSNAATMTPLQREARYWDEQGRPDGLLLGGAVLADAQTWATAQDGELTRTEREFLEASHREEGDRQRTVTAARRNRRIAIGMSVVGVLAVVGLLAALLMWRRAEDLKDTNARLSSTFVWRSIAQSPDATPRQNVGATLAALAARPPESDADRELTGLARNALYTAERSGYNDQTFALSADGAQLAIGEANGTVRIIAVDDNRTVTTIDTGAEVVDVLFDPSDGHGRLAVATLGDDALELTMWDLATGQRRPVGRAPRPTNDQALIGFAASGRAVGVTDRVASIQLWDVATGATINGPTGGVINGSAFAMTGDDELLAWIDQQGVLNLRSGQTGPVETVPAPDGRQFWGTPEFSPDDQYLALADDLGRVFIRTMATGEVRTVDVAAGGQISSVTFDDQGGTIRVLDDACFVSAIDLSKAELAVESAYLSGCSSSVGTGSLFADGGRRVVAPNVAAVTVWDALDGDILYSASPTLRFGQAATSGRHATALDARGRLTLRDLRQQVQWTSGAEGQLLVAMSADDNVIASATVDELQVHDVASGELLKHTLVAGGRFALAVDPAGRYVVLDQVDQVVVWDALLDHVFTIDRPSPTTYASAVAVTRFGLVALGTSDGVVSFWDAATGMPRSGSSLKVAAEVRVLSFDPTGLHLAIADINGQLWGWSAGGPSAQPFGEGKGPVNGFAWSEDYVAVAGQRRVDAYSRSELESSDDLSDVSPSLSMTGYTQEVHAIAFSADQEAIVAVEQDGYASSQPLSADDVVSSMEAYAIERSWTELEDKDCQELIATSCPS